MIYKYIKINKTLTAELHTLVTTCHEYDHCRQPYMLENDLEFLETIPRFFILRRDNVICSFASVFFVDETTVYLYGFTHPEYRNLGYMKQILSCILDILRPIGVQEIQIPVTSDNESGRSFAGFLNVTAPVTECLMHCDLKDIPVCPKCPDVRLIQKSSEDEMQFFLSPKQEAPSDYKENLIGSLFCIISGTSVSIFNVEILSQYRGMGYGTKLLNLTLSWLKQHHFRTISLHVTKENEPAYHLYKANGFTEQETVLYYRLNQS